MSWKQHGPLTLVVQDRAQQTLQVLAADDTGATRTLHTERDAAWINLEGRMPVWRPGHFLWSSERTGAWALSEHEPSGAERRVRVAAEHGYRSLVHVDDRALFFRGGPDATQSHLYRVDDTGVHPLTRAEGSHGAVFARGGATWVHLFRGADGTRRATVRARDGKRLGVLKDLSEPLPFQPRVQRTSVKVEGRTHHASLIRPRDFDPGKRYPVLVHVYGGPHAKMVTAGRRALRDHWYADQGFIVVAADGRGTPDRGRTWERAIRGNLAKIPLDDQVAVLQALGRRHRELDLTRVGIYGWSFGGYLAAMAVLRRPDVFQVAVAGAPVTDWRDYDTHYTERYMGLPAENAAGYDDASALTWAPKLRRPLLVIHGTADDNVYFTHAVKLSDALFRAGRAHELLPLSGFTHMVADPKVARSLHERVVGFLAAHLR